MDALGRHILVELYGCPPSALNDVTHIEQSMVKAAREAGATIINTTFHPFSPYGVSGTVVIQESHLAVHTWPEYGFAAVDLFTCGDKLDPWTSYGSLKASFQATHGSTLEMHRGQLNLLKKVASDTRPPDQSKKKQDVPQHFRNIWFTDKNEDIALSLRHAGMLYRKQSSFQKVEIFNTYGYGKMLVLDGAVTCTEKDEYIYHEMIVHVPMLTHPGSERALIIGGGDGGAARELLKHDCLSEVVLVEIDDAVVEASKAHLPSLASAFGDPRLTLKIQDGAAYIRNCPDAAFDLIVIDATYPIGPAETLFSREFYAQVHRCLKADGLMAAQTEPPTLYSQTFKEIYQHQRHTFGEDRVHCYLAFIPTYTTGMLSFSYASKGYLHPLEHFDPEKSGTFAAKHHLRYYNKEIHQAAFALPTFLKTLLEG